MEPRPLSSNLSTKRIKLVVAYDGTDFRGWAAQTGQRTVQSTLTEAVRQATGEDVEIIGASRTDSGAHALGQVCHFDSSVNMEIEKWPRVLNNLLTPDLAVQSSELVDEDFNARFCAEHRRYRYRINVTNRNPFTTRFVHDHCRTIDVELMKKAAEVIVGEHDFRGFTEEVGPEIENTVRKLFSVEVLEIDHRSLITDLGALHEVHVEIIGTAFLRGMMRRISGALLEIGRGHRPLDDMVKLLTPERDSMQWPVVLPAKGLCLMEVPYANPPRDNRTASKLA
jgi:tRNA pseudouridine38-40 synthase